MHFFVGAILYRMWHENTLCRRKTESACLHLGSVHEYIGGDEHRRHTPSFEIDDVVHTARRATASIGQGLDHQRAFGGDFMAQVDGGGLRECGFAKTQNLCPGRDKSRFELV